MGVCHENRGTGLSMVPLSLHCLRQRLQRHFNPSRVLILLVLFLFSSSAWAFPKLSLDQQYGQFNYVSNLDRGSEQYDKFYAVVYGNTLDFTGKIENFISYQVSEETHDFTVSTEVWPSVCQLPQFNLSFGGKSTYHFLDFISWSYEYDFLTEPFVKYTGKSDWYAKFSLGGQYKITKVKYFDINMTELFFTFNLEAKKFFQNGFELCFICANHDEYRYYVFPSPIFRYGAAFNYKKVKVYGNWQIHCCDMFTSKFYLNGRQFGAGVIIQL